MMHITSPSSLPKTEGMNYVWYPDTAGVITAENKGFTSRKDWLIKEPTTAGNFVCLIPLKILFNFASDYEKILYGYNICLTLVRVRITER